jgi:hypothetical protein
MVRSPTLLLRLAARSPGTSTGELISGRQIFLNFERQLTILVFRNPAFLQFVFSGFAAGKSSPTLFSEDPGDGSA